MNHATLITAPGPSAIAVVRVSGALGDFFSAHFSATPRLGRAVHGILRDADREIDDPVVALMAPDRADICLHGGPWVVRQALALLARKGFEVTPPSTAELSDDAIDVTDPVERQVLRHLPSARTERALRCLMGQSDAWNGALATGLTDAEIADIAGSRALWWLLNPPRVAIIGLPNAGKSTLANQLFATDRSIVADMPGTTRDWVGELADINGLAVMLVDTPGLRATDDLIEAQAIELASHQVRKADLIVIVLDLSIPLSDDARHMLDAHPGAVVVANKCDRPHAWSAEDMGAMLISGKQKPGIDALRDYIVRAFGLTRATEATMHWWTLAQRDALLQDRVAPGGQAIPLRS